MFDPVVFLVDDDHGVRDSLSLLIRSIGLKVSAYEHPQQFLDQYDDRQIGCLLLDIRMPSISGLKVQEMLNINGYTIPIIFITGHGDVAQCSRAFRAGAVDFLIKPIDEQVLIDSLQKAIKSSLVSHKHGQANIATQNKLNRLTERENEVLSLILDGLPNKMIARKFGVSTRTVESHRANVFEKLEVRSLAECVKILFTSHVQPRHRLDERSQA
jgi:two-component system response regulator FixJ